MPIDNEKFNAGKPQKPSTTGVQAPIPPSRDHTQALNNVQNITSDAVGNLAQAGYNVINTQTLAFDAKLTKFERGTAKEMADRIRQSPLRVQAYLVEELSAQGVQEPDYEIFAEEFRVPDLTSNWLAIAPSTAAGCLPM